VVLQEFPCSGGVANRRFDGVVQNIIKWYLFFAYFCIPLKNYRLFIMKTYQFYKEEGNLFIFKNQPIFSSVLAIIMLVIAGASYKYNFPLMGWFLVALAILIIANFFAKKFVIDPQQQTITCKPSVFVATKTYSFQDFTNFEVLAMKYLGFITTNVFLNIHFEVNGKEAKFMIGQTLTHKGIQKMVNETEDIMRLNENIR